MLWRNDWCSGCCCNAQLVVRVERGWSWHFFCPRRNESPYSHRDNSWVKNMFSNCLGEKRCSSPPEKRRATPEDGLPVGSGVSPTEQGLLCACGLEKENASIVQHLWIIQYRLGLIVQLSRKLVSNLSRHLVHMGHLEKKCQSRAWLMMASASWLTLQLNITHANNNYLHKFRNILKQTMLINASVFSKFELPTSHSNSSRPRNWIRQIRRICMAAEKLAEERYQKWSRSIKNHIAK